MIEKSILSNISLKESEWERLMAKTGEKTKQGAVLVAINAYLEPQN